MASVVEQPPSNQSTCISDAAIFELVAILGAVLLADFTIYRGHGYTGLATFIVGVLALFYVGKKRRHISIPLWIVAAMLVLVATHLVWYGSSLLVIIGFILVVTFATTLDGKPPYLLTVLAMGSQAILAGFVAIAELLIQLRGTGRRWQHPWILSVVLPALAFVLFSALFILANPDVVSFVGRHLEALLSRMSEWLIHVALRPTEPVFWIVVALVTAGLLRPITSLISFPTFTKSDAASKSVNSPLYSAYRNMLMTVIVLFAGYLAYEFLTLWTRKFPEGFHYSGYAHEGAAWLTVALALATLILSLVFSGRVLGDSRLPRLRVLAWIWSIQNILLSLSVYNRLFIYIDFNGMTRMRIVGLFGISVVVVGFLLVVWKIVHGKGFPWLIHRQVWAFAIAIYLYALIPVDGIAAAYNVRRVLNGDLSASMQIGVHKLDLEGVMALPPLLECSNQVIREGVAAIIADRYWYLQLDHQIRKQQGWTAFQLSDEVAMKQFQTVRDKWKAFEDQDIRDAAIQRFYTFAYRWY